MRPFKEVYNAVVVRKRIALLFSALVFLCAAQKPAVAYEPPPLGWLLLPGGTWFYEGEPEKGTAFAIGEASLLGAGIAAGNKVKTGGETPEVNLPLLLASQLYVVDKWGYYQKSVLRFKSENPGFGMAVDPAPLSSLLLSPFKAENISSPFVLAFAVLGALDGYYGYPRGGKGLGNVTRVTGAGNGMSRDTGTAYYGAGAFAASYGAGVAEEMLFRGMLMPIFDYRYGKRSGLVWSSVGFGLLHGLNPGQEGNGYLMAQAGLAGFILGWEVQENEYRLGKAIAAHFWYDFISMTATWIANPKENPLGVAVSFGF